MTLGSHCTSIGSIMPIFSGSSSALNAFSWKESVRAASIANIAALSGLLTIDGVLLADGDRVLVKNQAAGQDNGIYIVHAGAWTRAPDFDQSQEVVPGSVIPVAEGATQADTAWILVTDNPITIGVTPLAFNLFGTVTPLAGSPPPTITDSTNTTGVSGNAAREDHTHAHGARSGGTLHAVVTASVAGFASADDKKKLDSITKTFVIDAPTASEVSPGTRTEIALTVQKIVAVIVGTTPSVTFTIRYSSDRTPGGGTEVVTGGSTVTSTTTGLSVVVFNNPSIPAGSFIWLETTALSGSVSVLEVSLVMA